MVDMAESTRMTIQQAAEFTGRSPATIRRWRSEGVRIDDYDALMAHADMMDMRSIGKSATLARERPEVNNCLQKGPSFPGDAQKASQALATLEGLKSAFSKRLERAKKIGDETEAELLAGELGFLTEAHRLLDITLEGYLIS
jgi:hypothetical protein